MPYLRMFLGEEVIDQVFIPDPLFQSVLKWNIVDEEKRKLTDKHFSVIRMSDDLPRFVIDAVPSTINSLTPSKDGKDAL